MTAAPLLGAVARPPAVPGPVLEPPHRRAAPGAQRRPTPSTPAGRCWSPRTGRRCAGWSRTPRVRALLLGTDDGDEFWTAAGHVAVVRPDGQRPQLMEHHARLLGAVVGALSTLD